MTLGPDYARPRPRTIARHSDQPGGAAAPQFPAAHAGRGEFPLQATPAPPAPITGDLPAACAAESPSSGPLPQVAALSRFLWVSCG
jgi:hypothetical protein